MLTCSSTFNSDEAHGTERGVLRQASHVTFTSATVLFVFSNVSQPGESTAALVRPRRSYCANCDREDAGILPGGMGAVITASDV